MKTFASLVFAISLVACASLGGPRHIAVQSLAASHSLLSLVQDTEMTLKCDATGAPPAGQCVAPDLHKKISEKLATAFKLEGDAAKLTQALPEGAPQPAEVANILGQIAALVNDILGLIPGSPQQAALQTKAAAIANGGK